MHQKIPVLIPKEAIQERIAEVAREISSVYSDKPLTIVGVLTGSLVFLADLIRRIDLPLKIALVQASSYRGATTTSGELHLQSDLLPDLRERHVLILDDILDTGKTLHQLKNELQESGALSIRIAVLLRKLGRQEVTLEPDFAGFEIPDAFVVGYGLDYNDEYRNLPFIGILPEPV